jgi:K+-sensing histidine kinase KdpD
MGDHTDAVCLSAFGLGAIKFSGCRWLPCCGCHDGRRHAGGRQRRPWVTIPNLSLIFVVPVVIAGVWFGVGPSLCAALLGALAYNSAPRYSLSVEDPANIWAIALLFTVGLIVSGVAYTSGRSAADAVRLQRQAIVLQGDSCDVVAAGNTQTIVSITCEALSLLFRFPSS